MDACSRWRKGSKGGFISFRIMISCGGEPGGARRRTVSSGIDVPPSPLQRQAPMSPRWHCRARSSRIGRPTQAAPSQANFGKLKRWSTRADGSTRQDVQSFTKGPNGDDASPTPSKGPWRGNDESTTWEAARRSSARPHETTIVTGQC